jgi:putative ABC transport system permease protein
MRAYIPYNVMATFFPVKEEGDHDAISFINYQPRVAAEHLLAQEEVRKIVARNHGFDWHDEDAFEGWDTVKQAEMMSLIFDAMNMFLGTVGMVTLGLGAIGVINIMLVAVSDRTREIGLRKALGATNRSILFQFFLEGAFLTLMSGVVGVSAAMLIVHLLSGVNLPPGFDTPRIVPVSAIAAVLSLAFAGITAGLYPARKAAMLEPVEALRQE